MNAGQRRITFSTGIFSLMFFLSATLVGASQGQQSPIYSSTGFLYAGESSWIIVSNPPLSARQWIASPSGLTDSSALSWKPAGPKTTRATWLITPMPQVSSTMGRTGIHRHLRLSGNRWSLSLSSLLERRPRLFWGGLPLRGVYHPTPYYVHRIWRRISLCWIWRRV